MQVYAICQVLPEYIDNFCGYDSFCSEEYPCNVHNTCSKDDPCNDELICGAHDHFVSKVYLTCNEKDANNIMKKLEACGRLVHNRVYQKTAEDEQKRYSVIISIIKYQVTKINHNVDTVIESSSIVMSTVYALSKNIFRNPKNLHGCISLLT